MAGIDTSIYNALRPVQIDDPVNALAKVSQAQGAISQNKLAQMQLEKAERDIEQEGKFNSLWQGALKPDGTIDQQKLLTGAAQSGFGSKIPTLQKGFSEQEKAQSDAQFANLKAAREKQGVIASIAGAAVDQASWTRGKQQLAQMGVDVSQIPDQFDPQLAKSLVQQSLTGVQQLDQALKKEEFAYRQQNDKDNRSVTIRGQNMTDARGRDLAAATRDAGGAGKPPAGYRVAADGQSLEAIPGGPADPNNKSTKPTTEGEKASAGYGLRMVEAEKELDEVAKRSPKSQTPSLIERAAGDGVVANYIRNPDRQQYRQGQEDWVRAKLRKESGAAIPTEEMDREIQTYFPQPGDKDAVIQQKARARETARQAMGIAAGGAADMMNTGNRGAAPSGGAIDFGSLK